jgi:YHS domain-containing protein
LGFVTLRVYFVTAPVSTMNEAGPRRPLMGGTPYAYLIGNESETRMSQEQNTTDPVCGMKVSPETARSFPFEGATYYFCSQSCEAKFRDDPRKYARKPEPKPQQKNGAIYTCPMHPEVRQQGPGACPKCGMALEPLEIEAPQETEYTCPMHPEVVRNKPGSCPKCGMALEPRTIAANDKNPELEDMIWIPRLLERSTLVRRLRA